jgi:hypothetical protein
MTMVAQSSWPIDGGHIMPSYRRVTHEASECVPIEGV